MKAIKLTDEQLEQYSYADVANLVLEANGKKMKIQNLFEEVIKIMKLPESFFESKIGDFFGLLSWDDGLCHRPLSHYTRFATNSRTISSPSSSLVR